jgi:iron complex outermembrane receptor protein
MRWRLAFTMMTLAHAAHAQDDVEEVHVRGSQARGFESRAKVDDAPREITDAASLVEPLLGVHVRRLGADDGFATMSIRGSSSNQVAFYLAGVPLPAAGDPTVDLASLPLWPGSQARVHRTFTPASLGPSSLGGTLVIDPPRATDPPRCETWMAGGSFGSLRMRVSEIADAGHGVRIASGLSASRTDGDFSYYDVNHNAPILDPRAFVPRVNNDSAQASGLVSVTAPLKNDVTLRATTMLQAREQGLPGSIYAPTPLQRLRFDRELVTVELGVPAARGVVGAQAWAVRQGTDFRDPAGLVDLTASEQETTIFSAGGNVSYKARFGKFRIATKLDARGERYEPGTFVGPVTLTPTGATRTGAGLGVDGEYVASRAVTVAASARIDGWYDASDSASSSGAFDARPNANVGVELGSGAIRFAAHGGYTSRPANFVERFGAPGGFRPNANLKPESAATIDAGVRASKRFGKLRLEGELALFAQDAQDLITFINVGANSIPQAQNVSSAIIAGVEAELIARFYGLELRASYTGLYTENDDYKSHPPLPYRPAHDLVVDLSYQLGPFRLRYGLDGLFDMWTDAFGTVEVPSRVLHSAGLRLDVPKLRRVRVAFDVRNLFDLRTADYPQQFLGTSVPLPIGDVYSYPLPGRSFLLSVSWAHD